MKPTLLLGAPGTGKTYRLVEKILEMKPKKFALLSFTRRAANEAKQRLRMHYATKDLQYVRTIHSLCFEMLGLKQTQVIGWKELHDFGSEYGYEFSFRNHSEDDDTYFGLTDDDIMYRQMTTAIARTQTPSLDSAQMFLYYTKYKREKGLYDYNDMVNLAHFNYDFGKFDLLCVDEIQDLTPLQLQFIELAVGYSSNVIYAGDGNQMIFEWAGVDRERYFKLVAESVTEVLKTQYRLPVAIDFLAEQTINTDNYFRDFHTIDNSTIRYISSMPEIYKSESYLVLGRNGYIIREFMRQYDELGFNWTWLHMNESLPERNQFNVLASTIHGAKGAEADNVILLTDVSPATYEHMDSEAESRVWYVAVTRARERLYIVEPFTEMFYDLS